MLLKHLINHFVKKKSEQILEHLHEIRFKDGMKNIQSHFQAIEKSACVKVWAEQFHHNVSNFATFGKDFEFENLKTVFHYVYSTKVGFLKLQKESYLVVKLLLNFKSWMSVIYLAAKEDKGLNYLITLTIY